MDQVLISICSLKWNLWNHVHVCFEPHDHVVTFVIVIFSLGNGVLIFLLLLYIYHWFILHDCMFVIYIDFDHASLCLVFILDLFILGQFKNFFSQKTGAEHNLRFKWYTSKRYPRGLGDINVDASLCFILLKLSLKP